MLRLRQAIPTGSALCNNLGRVIGLEGATALKFPWSVLIDSLFFQRMLGRATALESLSISIGRVSVLSENVRKSYCAQVPCLHWQGLYSFRECQYWEGVVHLRTLHTLVLLGVTWWVLLRTLLHHPRHDVCKRVANSKWGPQQRTSIITQMLFVSLQANIRL